MSGTCGPTPFAYYEKAERRWDSSRMCLDFSAQDTSEPFSGTWPKQGSMRSGACWERTISVPRIVGSDCGFWPTATSRDWKDTGDLTNVEENCLLGRAVKKRWPTPRVSCSNGPSKSEIDAGDPKHRLETAVVARGPSTRRTWATPSSSNGDNCGGSGARAKAKRDGTYLSGSLNPTWVEWLMGFPRGWTDLEASATPKSLKRWLRRSRSWLEGLG